MKKYIRTRAIVFFLLLVTTLVACSLAVAEEATAIASPSLRIQFPVKNSTLHFLYTPIEGIAPDKDLHQGVYIYIQQPDNKKIYVTTLESEGGSFPIIDSVFLYNADDTPEKELFILFHWEIRHRGLGINGNLYDVRIFCQETDGSQGLRRLTTVEKEIGSGFEGTEEGGHQSIYPYKTAESIKKLLKNSKRKHP
jgi:hypothetical protein